MILITLDEAEREFSESVAYEPELSSPDWHREVLEEREKKIASGEESFVDWDVAKRRLRQELS